MKIGKWKFIPLSFMLACSLHAVPLVFNYQGAFQDSTGKPQVLKDSVKFSLYNRATAGTELWKETYFIDSPRGLFSVNLGSKTALSPALIFSSDSIYLEITKGAVKGTRIRINSVLYSVKAALADSSISARRSDSAGHAMKASMSDSAVGSLSAQHAVFADSAAKAGHRIWDVKGTTAYYNNGNVGIGSDSAREKLSVEGNALIENPSGDAGLYLVASANPSINFGQTGGAASDNRAKFVFYNNALYVNIWDSTGANEIPGVVVFRQKGNVIDAKGIVKATGFMVGNVPLNVPDYVFGEEYRLKSLQELDSYIKANRHLPGMPSSEEMNKEGMDLTRMNLKLMEKVEELTLYIISQDKTLRSLEEKLKENNK